MSTTYLEPHSNQAGALAEAMRGHWRLFMSEGVLLFILGLAAIVVPLAAGLAATVVLGWLFLIAGAAGLIFTIRAKGAPGFLWSMLSGVVALVAGGLLVWNPLQGLVTLTLVLTVFFVADGILMIALGLSHRRQLSGRWQWMVANGGIDLVLAFIVIVNLPGALAWAFGLLLGIDLAFGGCTLIAMARSARGANSPRAAV